MKRATKHIKPRSSKGAKADSEYARLRKKFLLDNPICYGLQLVPGCAGQATQVHHAAKRGEFLCRVDTFRALCHHCHEWAERNRRDAEGIGMTLTAEKIRLLREKTNE